VGWRYDELFVEVHRDVYAPANPEGLAKLVGAATKNRASVVDWARIDDMVKLPTGRPARI
jgi:hypothetical protein